MQGKGSDYDVIFDGKSIDFLKKLEFELRKRIFDKILATKSDPSRYFKRLKGRKDFSLRMGDYRAIADISSGKIIITKIGHRKNIYEN